MLGEGNQAASLFSLINPINSSSTRAGIHRYRVEPYVVAADIYSVAPHVGRGGWTWYTGSAGWIYQAGIEAIFGFRLRGSFLILDPCIPAAWPKFEIAFRYHSTRYTISVENPRGVQRGIAHAELDGESLPVGESVRVALMDDHGVHSINVILG
jgi:cyclic beta-1,2-glucan synthetase